MKLKQILIQSVLLVLLDHLYILKAIEVTYVNHHNQVIPEKFFSGLLY